MGNDRDPQGQGLDFGERRIGQLEGIAFKFYPNVPVNGIVFP